LTHHSDKKLNYLNVTRLLLFLDDTI